MKINGHKTLPLPTKTEYFSRAEGVFEIKITAVPNFNDFNKLVPMPSPRYKTFPDGTKEALINEPEYQQRLMDHVTRQSEWSFMTSLRENPHIEFENVNPGDPTTWKNVEIELREILIPSEVARVISAWNEVNGISSERIKQTRDNFLSGQLQPLPVLQEFHSQGEQPSTASTEPANASE